MTNGWQVAKIGEVAEPIERAEEPQAGTSYRQVGVRLWGQGAYERESIDGSETKYKTLSRIESGDIIVNKIWARNGSVAVVSDALAGCFGSGEFPTFAPDRNKLEPKWFHWITKTRWFWDACDVKSQGTSGKNRIRPEKFLDIEIPLPPLTEQRRIVAHIESLAARVNEAQRLREEADNEAKSLLNSALSKITQDLLANHEPQTLEELTLFIGDMNHEMPKGQDKGIPFVSPKDFIKTDGNIGIDFDGAKKITREDFERLSKKARPQKGDILMARYGTIGAARYVETDREFLASYSIAVIRPNPELVDGRFLYWMSISPYVQEQAIKGIRGSSMADLGLKTIREFIIPHLNFDEQRRIVAYLDGLQAKVNALRELQVKGGEELSALMPSILDKAFKGEL